MVKISSEGALLSQVKKNPSGAILFYGESPYYIQDRLNKVIEIFKEQGFASEVISQDTLLKKERFLEEEVGASTLFGPPPFFILKEVSDKVTAFLKSYDLQRFSPPLIVVAAEYLKPRSSLRKFFEETPTCFAVACYAMKLPELKNHLRKILLGSYQKSIDSDALDVLGEYLQNQPEFIPSELEKLFLYTVLEKEKPIKVEDVLSSVVQKQEGDANNLLKALLKKETTASIEILFSILASGESTVPLVRILQGNVLKLHHARVLIDHGMNGEAAFRMVGFFLPRFEGPGWENLLKTTLLETLENLLLSLIELEGKVKLSSGDEKIVWVNFLKEFIHGKG